jgi:hypothetical protein
VQVETEASWLLGELPLWPVEEEEEECVTSEATGPVTTELEACGYRRYSISKGTKKYPYANRT